MYSIGNAYTCTYQIAMALHIPTSGTDVNGTLRGDRDREIAGSTLIRAKKENTFTSP